MRNRQDEIRTKGFDMISSDKPRDYDGPLDYRSIKVGTKTLEDAVINLGSLKRLNKQYGDKDLVFKALHEKNLPLLREISNYFYDTSGIYFRVCKYFAYLYRYDWYVYPEVFEKESLNLDKVAKDCQKIVAFLDNSNLKALCGDIAMEVIKNGAYYGYIVPSSDCLILQQLPINYCRSIFKIGQNPVVEFNMRFFDEQFKDPGYRIKVLKLFPPEFQKGYMLYKTGKLDPVQDINAARGVASERLRSNGWYILDPQSTVKFSVTDNDVPLFVNAIPAILDLDAAQDLDRRKQMQDLLKIIIQQLPLDKNGDLIFDVDEARDIHNNAVSMLKHAIGVDVLTTFADIQVADLADKNTTTTTDDLQKVERGVYNAFGISRNLFNTDGNLSLEKSILDDESMLRTLPLAFNSFFNRITIALGSGKKKYHCRFHMLETTQYNYQNLAKMYKEQAQTGSSKLLTQIALGHSQSEILSMAYFENEVLHLSEIMIPPLMSSTLSSDAILGKKDQSGGSNSQNSTEAGRPEKADGEKSDKTIQNKESMS